MDTIRLGVYVGLLLFKNLAVLQLSSAAAS